MALSCRNFRARSTASRSALRKNVGQDFEAPGAVTSTVREGSLMARPRPERLHFQPPRASTVVFPTGNLFETNARACLAADASVGRSRQFWSCFERPSAMWAVQAGSMSYFMEVSMPQVKNRGKRPALVVVVVRGSDTGLYDPPHTVTLTKRERKAAWFPPTRKKAKR